MSADLRGLARVLSPVGGRMSAALLLGAVAGVAGVVGLVLVADVLRVLLVPGPGGVVDAAGIATRCGGALLAGVARAGLRQLSIQVSHLQLDRAGSIRIGDVDVRDMRDPAADTAVVFQDVFLFDDTIAENIRVGRPDATDQQVETAAREAGCSFVDDLPQGWRTPVGEIGGLLSGGERQRVSIARAILKDAPIVLLDEPTAALDAVGELAVQHALDRLCAHKTVLVIAHRLSTVRAADQILVLDAGTITERGTHTELLAAAGRYAALWHAQQRHGGWRLRRQPGP